MIFFPKDKKIIKNKIGQPENETPTKK